MAEKTIKWQCASKNGKSLDSSSGVSFSIGGETIPAHAKISKITVTVSLSVNQAKNPNRLYFLKATRLDIEELIDIEYADELTLRKALSSRIKL